MTDKPLGETSNFRIADFLFEVGTLRKLARMHRQVLFVDDISDSIASHSYRVCMIGYFLARIENVDAAKVLMMTLFHDVGEARSNDHNWIHKRYVKIFDDEINKDQLAGLPAEVSEVVGEYEERQSKEAIVAKDSDTLDQILLLREYEWQGSVEAKRWLYGANGERRQLDKLKLASSVELANAIYDRNPSDWWQELSTNVNR